VSSELESDGKELRVDVFVDAPYNHFVTVSSRFWNASGVDLSLDASGFRFNTQSLATVIAGGVAFGPPPVPGDASPAPESADFDLFDDVQSAMDHPTASRSICACASSSRCGA
jgi:paraquat-inducible protein B